MQPLQDTPNIFFWCIKTWKWKILYFSKKWHPKNPCATIWKFSKCNNTSSLMPCLHKKFAWLANGTVLEQNSLNSSGGFRDADPKLLCSLGMKVCPPRVFRVLSAEVPSQTLQLYNTNWNIWLRQNNSLDLVLTYG